LCIDKSVLACWLYCTRVVGTVLVVFLWRWRKIWLHITPANGKQGQIPDEMSQTLLTNKKQGNLD
jgi:hypothetical protein